MYEDKGTKNVNFTQRTYNQLKNCVLQSKDGRLYLPLSYLEFTVPPFKLSLITINITFLFENYKRMHIKSIKNEQFPLEEDRALYKAF